MVDASIAGTGAGGKSTREERGIELYRDGAFARISPEIWLVENPKRKSVHTVDLEAGTCDCPDHRQHKHIPEFRCYHRIAVELYAAWLRRSARGMTYLFGEVA